MAAIVTRAGKGAPLTNAELDANFVNLNTELGGKGPGDVVGPAASTDLAIARFNGATGKLLKNSTVRIGDNGFLAVEGPGAAVKVVRDGGAAIIEAESFGASSEFNGKTYRGTQAAPLNVLSGWALAAYGGSGFDGNALTGPQASMWMRAAQDWTPTAHGSDLLFFTTPIDNTVPRATWRIAPSGDFLPETTFNIGTFGARVGTVYTAYSDVNQLSRINRTSVVFPTVINGETLLQLSAPGGARVEINTFGGSPAAFEGRAAGGTPTAPSGVIKDQWLTYMGAWGYGTTGYSDNFRAGVIMSAAEAWTDTAQGTTLYFGVTPIGTKVVAFPWRLNPDGHLVPSPTAVHDIGATNERVRYIWADGINLTGNIQAASGSFGPEAMPAMGGQAGVNRVLYWNTSPTLSALVYQVGTTQLDLILNGVNVSSWTTNGLTVGSGAISTTGANAGVAMGPRDGSGIGFMWYNPSGDDLRLFNGTYDAVVFGAYGDLTLNGVSAALVIKPRGGTGTHFTWYNPNGTELRLHNGTTSDVLMVDTTGEITFGPAADKIEPRGRYWNRPAPPASITLTMADQGSLIVMNTAAPATITIPPHSAVLLPYLARIDIVAWTDQPVTFVAGAGVAIRSAGGKLKLTGRYSGATLIQVNIDEWYLVGDIAA